MTTNSENPAGSPTARESLATRIYALADSVAKAGNDWAGGIADDLADVATAVRSLESDHSPTGGQRRIEELLDGVRGRRANLAGHQCPGFDCAICEPSRDIEELDEVLDLLTGRNVE